MMAVVKMLWIEFMDGQAATLILHADSACVPRDGVLMARVQEATGDSTIVGYPLVNIRKYWLTIEARASPP
jgi:hypothetical protein